MLCFVLPWLLTERVLLDVFFFQYVFFWMCFFDFVIEQFLVAVREPKKRPPPIFSPIFGRPLRPQGRR
jgi:hypothetical protein